MSNTRAVRIVFVMEKDGFFTRFSPSTLVLTGQISLIQCSVFPVFINPSGD